MPSVDIVSEIDMQELDNAVNQTCREIATRFDFKGTDTKVEYDKTSDKIKIITKDDLKLRAIHQILESKMARRELDCRTLKYGEEKPTGNKMLKQEISIKHGLEKEDAKKITKIIKGTKLKVSAQIQQNQVRMTGKKIDDLQQIMSILKADMTALPLQFINMRS